MRNLSGFLKKTLLAFSAIAVFPLIQPSTAFAASNSTALDIEYQISESGDLRTDLEFTITNNSIIPTVVNYYTVTLPFSNLKNLVVSYNGRRLDKSVHKQNVGSDIVINFDSSVIPINGKLKFNIVFSKPEHIDTKGSVAYLSFPASFPEIAVKTVIVKYPKRWADVVWSSSVLARTTLNGDFKTAQFSKPKVSYLNVVLGENLVYSFAISKTISNSDSQGKLFDISIPSWSSSQRILFSKITPQPDLVSNDSENNLTFSYLIGGGKSAKIQVVGEVLMAQSTDSISSKSLGLLTENSGYWAFDDDSEYKRVTLYLRQNGLDISSSKGSFGNLGTDKDKQKFINLVYNYILSRFTLAQLDETSIESPLRAGVSLAIQKKGEAVPEDYGDLLISIFRHFGVPARMIVGYVPESAGYKTSGFFHSWVEYWDQQAGRWIVLDPALDDSLDADLYKIDGKERISIITRAANSISPKLTYFDIEELSVRPTISSIDEHLNADIELTVNSAKLTSKYIQAQLIIENTGTVPLQLSSISLFDMNDREIATTILSALSEEVILPQGKVAVPIALDNLAKEELNQEIRMQYTLSDLNGTQKTTVKSAHINIVTYWWWDWLIKLISFIIFSTALGIIYVIFKRLNKIWS